MAIVGTTVFTSYYVFNKIDALKGTTHFDHRDSDLCET